MRIGMITGEYPPMQGGVGDFTRELAHALADANHTISVFTTAHPERSTPQDGISVEVYKRNWTRALLGQIVPWVTQHRIDVLNLQFEIAAFNMASVVCLLPSLVKTRIVTTFHDLLPPYLWPGAGEWRQRAIRYLARRSTGAIVTNRVDERALRQASVDPALIPIGSNITVRPPPDYDRMAWRDALSIPRGRTIVGYFGFLNATKGVDTLLLAAQQLPDIHLLMIGGETGASDPANQMQASAIRAQANALGLQNRITWTGFVNETEKVSAHLLAADMMALPFTDGISFRRGSFMAALVHGRAIITTYPTMSTPELEQDKNVLLIAPNSPVALADAVMRVQHDAALRLRLEHNARALGETFAWPRIADQTIKVLSNAGITHRLMARR